MSSYAEKTQNKQRVEVMLDQDRLSQKINDLGQQITADYAGKSPIFLGILKGCFVFLSDLIRAIDLPMEVDFISAASYRQGMVSDDQISLGVPTNIDVKDRHILLVEGIVDTGRTVTTIKEQLKDMEPASVEIVTLLDKPTSHRVKLDIKYRGFIVGNEFVIGFGLDNAQKYRNLPFVGKLVDN